MTKEQFELFITEQTKFTFAKTMANIPHSWIVRSDYDDNTFLAAMEFIRDNGYQERFYSKVYTYYNVGEYKYWVMTGKDGFNCKGAIINRAKI
jgi:hypothetical protein